MEKEKAPRAHAEDFLKQMQEENEAQKGSETLLDGLKEFRFKAVLDSKDIEAITGTN